MTIYEQPLDQYLRMISGRMVVEQRGSIWVIKADFADIDTELLRKLTTALQGRYVHNIAFLPPNGKTDLIVSRFCLTAQPNPALRSWIGDLPEWASLSYTFEEEEPHEAISA